MIYNDYYPECTSPDGFENYGGHHIDDRMRRRGDSYGHRQLGESSTHYFTAEEFREKQEELAQLRKSLMEQKNSMKPMDEDSRLVGAELNYSMSLCEDLAFKIRNLESILRNTVIIKEGTGAKSIVGMRSKVTVEELKSKTRLTLRIVGANEVGAEMGSVSCVSPVGSAIMKRSVGDIVGVEVGGNAFSYKILAIA